MFLIATGALTVGMITALFAILLFAALWWPMSDLPERADALLVLAGAGERPMYAADLYMKGYGHGIYVTRPARESGRTLLEQHGVHLPTEEEMSQSILISRGVPVAVIHVLPDIVSSTIDEAHAALTGIPAEVKSLLIVTSHDHARRARLIFRDVFSERGVKINVVLSPYENLPLSAWGQITRTQAQLELVKTILYVLGIHYSKSRIQSAELL
jgi:uncharacterized SAM-binding protein YcdF (DUF218 family)